VVVVDMGVASPIAPHPDLLDRKIALGTRDFTVEPAMTRDQARQAVETGITIVSDVIAGGADLIATGDMGIGNTTASSAIVAAITGEPVAPLTGRGTGVDDTGLTRKVAVIERALALHRPISSDGLDVLAKVGGFEIGGLAGGAAMAGALDTTLTKRGHYTLGAGRRTPDAPMIGEARAIARAAVALVAVGLGAGVRG